MTGEDRTTPRPPRRPPWRVPVGVLLDLERGACPGCDGWGCSRCDFSGFRPEERVGDTGYGWHRLVFWPWHYVQHVRRGIRNGYYSRLFCTWCVDDRMRDFLRPRRSTP